MNNSKLKLAFKDPASERTLRLTKLSKLMWQRWPPKKSSWIYGNWSKSLVTISSVILQGKEKVKFVNEGRFFIEKSTFFVFADNCNVLREESPSMLYFIESLQYVSSLSIRSIVDNRNQLKCNYCYLK